MRFPTLFNYTYPPYCSGEKTLCHCRVPLTTAAGTGTTTCQTVHVQWTLDPQQGVDSVSSITLTFNRFETSTGDDLGCVRRSGCIGPAYRQFSGSTLPAAITSTGNKLHLEFTSADTPGPGFFATYKTAAPVWCGGVQTITADTAEISDGSFGFNYHNSQNCKWKVMPQNGQPLTLYFRSFDTEANTDLLKIYDLTTQTLIAEVSGHYDSARPA